jgi:hypothetical protein
MTDLALGGQHAVKGITVLMLDRGGQSRLGKRERQGHPSLVPHYGIQLARKLRGDDQTTQTNFLKNFVGGGRTEENFVVGIGHRFSRRPAESSGIFPPPKGGVCVEEQFHCPSHALSSPTGSGASKSSAMTIFPENLPGRRGAGDGIGVSMTLGFPALAMMIVSPSPVRSISRERWVFAS